MKITPVPIVVFPIVKKDKPRVAVYTIKKKKCKKNTRGLDKRA